MLLLALLVHTLWLASWCWRPYCAILNQLLELELMLLLALITSALAGFVLNEIVAREEALAA